MRPSHLSLGLAACAALAIGGTCAPANPRPAVGSQLFASPQANPLALSCDGSLLYVVNTTAGELTVLGADPPHALVARIGVGLDPVGVAVRPKLDCNDPAEDEQVLVTNHVSDSISVVSRAALSVVQTLQELDAEGVTMTDEPVGVAFADHDTAYVTLDEPNQVVKLGAGPGGAWQLGPRATLTAQAPRALGVVGSRIAVAAFESGNQTEFPSCGASDPVSFDRNNPVDEGCLFPLNLTTLLQFATSPNIGGEVVHDGDIPDRDLFLYDADLNLQQSVTGVGTLLYGLAVTGSRVWITGTEARNQLDGLLALGDRMFENRLSFVDCNPVCGAVTHVDLDANGFGVPVPTPYGIAASANGSTLVVSAAGSDGLPGLPGDPGTDIPGLVTVSSAGVVLGHVQTGAIPQGVALRSDAGGDAETAYVLNTVEGTLSVVDVSAPAAPVVTAVVSVGPDPTPEAVKRGRIAFATARASTNGTFSCESCHPDGNIDQLLWTINTLEGPADVPGCDPVNENCPEPRSTMPVRGLRDTLPLHWSGSLSDPFPGVFLPEDAGAPDCDLASDGEVGCVRDVVDASLAGVMCAQPGCPTGPSGLPGALTAAERDDMAAFLDALAYPPSPARHPDDALSAEALQGVDDFFTDNGGISGFAPTTCANAAAGCHALPLTVATNSLTVGRFDAPTMRGLWDRHLLFSNGLFSSEEFLGTTAFDPDATGMSEFGSLAATFPSLFTLAYGVPVDGIWALVNEQSVGLPGLTGRQLELDVANAGDAGVGSRLAQLEAAATEGRITASARIGNGEYRFVPTTGLWTPAHGAGLDSAGLRALPASLGGLPVTVTAKLPANLVAGGAARQPLLWPSPADTGDGSPNLPVVAPGAAATLTVAAAYVEAGAALLVDGALCAACSVVPGSGTVDLTLDAAPSAPGIHVLQVLNPEAFASNELPLCVGSSLGSC